MIPTGGISTILSASKSLFSGLKPVIFLLLGVMLAFIIIEFLIDLIFKRANEEGDVQRLESKIIGTQITGELKEVGFLARHFRAKLPAGWQREVKEKILQQRFEELKKKYDIAK